MRELLLAVGRMDRVAAEVAISRGANPLSIVELTIRSRDSKRLAFTLQLLTLHNLQYIRRLALQLLMMNNHQAEYLALKRWIFEMRKCQRTPLRGSSSVTG